MPDSFVEAQHEAAHAFFSANGYLDHATASELQVCPHHLSIARLSKMCACSWLPGLQPCRSWRVSSRVRSLCTENAPMVVDLFTPRLSVWTFMSSLVGAGARQPASGCIAILCLRKSASRSRVGLFPLWRPLVLLCRCASSTRSSRRDIRTPCAWRPWLSAGRWWSSSKRWQMGPLPGRRGLR